MREYAYTKKYFGTTATVTIIVASEITAQCIAEECFALCAVYEAQFSRFIPTSELSLLNTKKHAVVSPELFSVIERSYQAYSATQGLYNPLLQVERLGYDRDFSHLKNIQPEPSITSYNIDFKSTIRDPYSNTIILQSDQQLDFGGFLKGYLAEKIATHIAERYTECAGIIVNLGGDLHTIGVDEHGEPFIFFIYNPVSGAEIPIALTNTSLATSGTYTRTWQTTERTYHHIMHPDGINSTSSTIVSASVIHPDGGTTEAFAKALLIHGTNDFPHAPPNLQHILITNSGEILSNII